MALAKSLERSGFSWKSQNALSYYFRSTFLNFDDPIKVQVDLERGCACAVVVCFGLASLLALSLGQVPARAAGATVDIEADSMEIIDADHKTIFRGNVVVKRPTDTIQADEMVVSSSQQKQSDGTTKTVTDFVDAKGGVTIRARDAVITGASARFDVIHDQLVVSGDVKLVQGQSVVQGNELHADLKTLHLKMTGGRVNGSFAPK